MTHSWKPIDLRDIADSAPIEPVLSGLLYGSGLHVLYGEPETSKSWLALIVCLEQIRNGNSVCYLDFEMSAPSVHERLSELGATTAELGRFLYFNPSESILNKQIQSDIRHLLEETPVTLVVVDALAGILALHALDGNNTNDVESLYSNILAPFRASAAVLALDHVTKDRETRGRWAIGSQRKLGGADVAIMMETVGEFSRGGKGLFKLRVQKDRFGGLPRPYAAELELESDPYTEDITYRIKHAQTRSGGRSQRPTDCMDKVLELLSEAREPVSRSFVRETLQFSPNTTLRAINLLILEARISEQLGQHGAKMLALTLPVSSCIRDSEIQDNTGQDGVLYSPESSCIQNPGGRGPLGPQPPEGKVLAEEENSIQDEEPPYSELFPPELLASQER